MDQPRYLIVDDDPVLARLIARHLSAGGAAVSIAETFAQGASMACSGEFIGVILDVHLPDGSGLDVLRAMRAASVDTPALVLTAHPDERVVSAAQSSAARVLEKPATAASLTAFATHAETAQGAPRVALSRTLTRVGARYGFTARQREILFLASCGLDRSAISATLGIGPATLKTHVHRLVAKARPHQSLSDLVDLVHRELFAASGPTAPRGRPRPEALAPNNEVAAEEDEDTDDESTATHDLRGVLMTLGMIRDELAVHADRREPPDDGLVTELGAALEQLARIAGASR